MKAKLLLGSIATAMLMSAGSAYAADGTVNFTGTISAATCTVTTPSTVVLPVVRGATLATAGAVAGTTPFTLSLSGCVGDAANLTNNTVTATFESGANVDGTSGNLVNTAPSGATGVEIQLLANGNSATPINLNTPAASQTTATPQSLANTNVSLSYAAQYISLGSPTPGAVAASAMFDLVYN